jgi:hypothetical protein
VDREIPLTDLPADPSCFFHTNNRASGSYLPLPGFNHKRLWMALGISPAEMLGLREQAAEEGADAGDDGVAGLRIFLLRLLALRRWRFD